MSLTGHEEDPTIRRVLSEASEQNHKDPTKHNTPLKPQSRIMRIKNQACIISLKPQSRIMRIKIRHGIVSQSLVHNRGLDTASWCRSMFDERIMEHPTSRHPCRLWRNQQVHLLHSNHRLSHSTHKHAMAMRDKSNKILTSFHDVEVR